MKLLTILSIIGISFLLDAMELPPSDIEEFTPVNELVHTPTEQVDELKAAEVYDLMLKILSSVCDSQVSEKQLLRCYRCKTELAFQDDLKLYEDPGKIKISCNKCQKFRNTK